MHLATLIFDWPRNSNFINTCYWILRFWGGSFARFVKESGAYQFDGRNGRLCAVAVFSFLCFYSTRRLLIFCRYSHLILAKLLWEEGFIAKQTRLDDPLLLWTKSSKMVDGHDFAKDQEHYRMNHTGLVLFIAASSAFIACFVLQFFLSTGKRQ